jgi:cyclophilin family peptidyl-prolyl cis-trans isomerase
VGTAKRERQKANKAMREQEVARQRARSRTTRIGLLVAGAIIAVFALVFIAGRFIDNGDDTGDSLATTDQPVTSTAEPFSDEPTASQPVDDPSTDAATDSTPDEPAVAEASVGCPPAEGSDEQIQEFDGPPPMCLAPDATYSAKITTSIGELTVDLDPEQAPNAVNSFVFLARYNYFDDTVCHRVIQGFVTQCGDPTASGTGGPGYEFADELPEAGQYAIGSLAMANSGPDTNGSQFFIISGDGGAQLPPLYSLFGNVVDADLDVVTELDALGSLDQSGVSSEEIRILDVEIIES